MRVWLVREVGMFALESLTVFIGAHTVGEQAAGQVHAFETNTSLLCS